MLLFFVVVIKSLQMEGWIKPKLFAYTAEMNCPSTETSLKYHVWVKLRYGQESMLAKLHWQSAAIESLSTK